MLISPDVVITKWYIIILLEIVKIIDILCYKMLQNFDVETVLIEDYRCCLSNPQDLLTI